MKELINAVSGFYFVHMESTQFAPINTEQPNVNEDIQLATTSLKLEDIVDMQQFIILYFLLLRNNDIDCDFDFIIKYKDGYGVNGRWMRQPISNNLSQCDLIDNVIDQYDEIANLLGSSMAAFFDSDMLLVETSPEMNRIINDSVFLFQLLSGEKLKDKIANYINLGWKNDHFEFNGSVKDQLSKWTKHYPSSVARTYEIIVSGDNPSNQTHILIPTKDFQYLQEKNPEMLESYLDMIFTRNTTNQNNKSDLPLWIKFDYKHNLINIDNSKY